jgi:pyruvate,water dikinase
MSENKYVRRLEDLTHNDVAATGGKNASLGEMIQTLGNEGVRVLPGFATTAQACRDFLEHNELNRKLRDEIDAMHSGDQSLETPGEHIRKLFRKGTWPQDVEESIRDAYRTLSEKEEKRGPAVAVRSSATAEDLPNASFAGQQETFLNVTGQDDLLDACRKCYASLFTCHYPRLIYRHPATAPAAAAAEQIQPKLKQNRSSKGMKR